MNFIDLIQNDICHPEAIHLTAGPMFYCNQCNNRLNIYEYITMPSEDYFRSSTLAQAYFAWTGDENVPMNFTLVDLEGIFPKTVFKQSLSRVRKSVQLLKALNAPFTTRPYVDCFKDMETFLMDFLNIIYEHPGEESNQARNMLEALIKAMHNLLSCKEMSNPFETYFDTIVPYVQQCFTKWQPLKVNESYPNLAVELLINLRISSLIRQTFGKFSIPFDVIHVMVSCFACSVDIDVVGNWVLDLMARICRGQYFWKNYLESPFVVKMNQLIENEITPTQEANFYQTLKAIREGQSVEYYSKILKPFYEVQMFLKRKFHADKNNVMQMAFMQTFPAICFQDHGDNLGFTMAYNYLIQTINSNNGKIEKGIFKTAKRIHLSVQKFVYKIQQFESMPTPNNNLLWTMDTFKLFMASDEEYEKEIQETIKTLLNNKDGK